MSTPFKFLDSYTREDRAIFFGREKEIEELYRKVFESKILLVYGISGTGKSSLIHCGLANKFQESDWLPVNVRRGGDFLESMAMALKQVALTPVTHELKTPQQFRKAVRSVYLDHYKPVFFLFDQFEELFIFGSAQEKELFLQVFKNLLASDIQCRFLFILREEYLASLSPFEKAIPGFFSNRLRIERMSHENASQAIEGPCRVHGIEVEEGFAKKVLEKLCPDENEVELTFLQVYLDRLYRLAQNKQGDSRALQFRENLLVEAGSVTDILGNFVDEQIALQPDPEVALAALKAFVSTRGTRQPMDLTEVKEYALSIGKPVSEKDLTILLATLVNLRILQDKDQHGKYELRHDALAAKIYEKFTLVEKELLDVRRFVESAFQNFQSRGILLGKDDLNYLDGYGNRLVLPSALNDFVQMNRQKNYAQQRAFRRLSWISAVIFLFMVGGVVQYIIRTQNKEDVQQLAYKALFQSKHSVTASLATICSTWEKDSSSIVLQQIFIRNVHNLLYESTDSGLAMNQFRQEFAPVDMGDSIIHAEVQRNGEIIVGWLAKQTTFIYEPEKKKLTRFSPGFEILAIEVADDRDRLAIISLKGQGKVFDFSGNIIYSFIVSPNYLMNERLACFFPHGNCDMAFVRGKDAIITDSLGKELFVLRGHQDWVNSVDVSPDGRFIATASSDKSVLIWNYNHHTKIFSPYDTLTGHNDTVWSVEFQNQGLYLLTASSDTTTRLWSLDGSDLNPGFYFGRLVGGKESHLKKNDILVDNDKFDPRFSIYYGKCCNASFSLNGYGFITCFYDYKPSPAREKYYETLFDINGLYHLQRIMDPLLEDLDPLNFEYRARSFSDIAFSDNSRFAALCLTASDDLVLSTVIGYKVLSLKGSSPMFSTGSKNLYWIQGKKMYILPLNPTEIKKFLTGDIDGSLKDIWFPF